jgi:SAM-dependent methyltransferase
MGRRADGEHRRPAGDLRHSRSAGERLGIVGDGDASRLRRLVTCGGPAARCVARPPAAGGELRWAATADRTGDQAVDYFERIWASVPVGAEPENFALRRDYLLANVDPGDRVLDVGCGDGRFTAALAEAGARAVGVEVAAEPLRRARARNPELEFVALDGEPTQDRGSPELPFPHSSFDVVWAGELIEHLRDPAALLVEIRRVLTETGRLLLSTPDHPLGLRLRLALSRPAFESHFDPRSDHLRFFTAHSLRLMLEDAGFDRPRVERRHRTLLARAAR